MSFLGEKTLTLLLTDTESLDHVARVGMNTLTVPSIELRQVVDFAMTFHRENGVAPSIEILKQRFTPDLFARHQIDLEEFVEEPIDWALTDLKATWIQQEGSGFVRKMATSLGSVAPEDQPDMLNTLSAELSAMSLAIQPRNTHVDLRYAGGSILADYEYAASFDGIRGMRLGIPEIDAHIGGVWPGELAVLGGPSGTGKSFFANWVAYCEWRRGKSVTLFTLENSIAMTQMRIASFALGLDITALQNGQLPPESVARLAEWCNDVLPHTPNPLHIINPETVGRSPQAVVQSAKAHNAEVLVIDQLTHLAAVDPSRSKSKRNEEVAEIVRTLAEAISTGRDPLPCLLLHQIKREGIKEADRTGRLVMTDMAESSEVERSASLVASLYQTDDDKVSNTMKFQGLKFRRVAPLDFELYWKPWAGEAITLYDDQGMAKYMESPEGQKALVG